jgi:hypothetical protein
LKKSRFSDEQIDTPYASPKPVRRSRRSSASSGSPKQRFTLEKKKVGAMGTAEIRELRRLREENSTSNDSLPT